MPLGADQFTQELMRRVRGRRGPTGLGDLAQGQSQDLGLNDPQIQQLLQPVEPFGMLRQAIQTPLNSLLDLVGLSPGGQPSAGGAPASQQVPGATPPIVGQGGPSGKEILGRTLSGLGTSLPLLLLAKNNPAMARVATEQANIQSQQNLQRLQQILQERRSRRQEGLQREDANLRREELGEAKADRAEREKTRQRERKEDIDRQEKVRESQERRAEANRIFNRNARLGIALPDWVAKELEEDPNVTVTIHDKSKPNEEVRGIGDPLQVDDKWVRMVEKIDEAGNLSYDTVPMPPGWTPRASEGPRFSPSDAAAINSMFDAVDFDGLRVAAKEQGATGELAKSRLLRLLEVSEVESEKWVEVIKKDIKSPKSLEQTKLQIQQDRNLDNQDRQVLLQMVDRALVASQRIDQLDREKPAKRSIEAAFPTLGIG